MQDGFAIERNTRYPSDSGGNEAMFESLLEGRLLNGWVLRKILETSPDYGHAIAAIQGSPFASTEYAVLNPTASCTPAHTRTGPRDATPHGAVLSRDVWAACDSRRRSLW